MDTKQSSNTVTKHAIGNSLMKPSTQIEKLLSIMKKIVQIALLATALVISACSAKKKPVHKPQPKQLFVLVYDISASNNQYGILKKEHLKTIYKLMGENGGGRFYGLHIKAYSLQQDPVRITVPSMGLMKLSGNWIQRDRQKQKNEKQRKAFLKGENEFVHKASVIIQPKSKPFSDIEHAMDFVKQIIAQPFDGGKEWQAKVLIISDMINDLPPENGHDKMEPIKLAPKAQVVVVRPHPDIELSKIFPGTNVNTVISIQDGINILLQ